MRIGSFTVAREIGRGGMGVVYLARDTRLDRPVAIKALPEELASDSARMERFEREARALALAPPGRMTSARKGTKKGTRELSQVPVSQEVVDVPQGSRSLVGPEGVARRSYGLRFA